MLDWKGRLKSRVAFRRPFMMIEKGKTMLKPILLACALCVLSACANTHTGGYFGAGNGGAAGGVTQSFRW